MQTRRPTTRYLVDCVLVSALWAVVACKGEDDESRLQQRAQSQRAADGATPQTERADAKAADDDGDGDEQAGLTAGLLEGEQPPPDAERVKLRLALPEDRTYRVTTVAMVELPMVGQATGYAREERITFDACSGEGAERRCTLRHRYTEFDAEPPTGRFLEVDERRVQPFTSVHPIDALGRRDTKTRLEGPTDSMDESLADDLAEVHRLYCIRFPKEPVAVGAKWKDTCKTFDRGVAVTRNLLWELAELTDDPVSGKRAELRAVGEYIVPSEKGPRKGTVEVIFYFFADKGEPHLIRERTAVPVSEEKNAYTKSTLNLQFATVVPGDPETYVRTDGQPFPEPEPGTPPLGDTPPGPDDGKKTETPDQGPG